MFDENTGKVSTRVNGWQYLRWMSWERYLRLNSATQKTCREAYNNYLIKTLTSDQNGNKRLGAIIKSKQHDHLGDHLRKVTLFTVILYKRQTLSTVNLPLSLPMKPRHHSQTLDPVQHIGRVVRMSVSGYRGWPFEPRHQYVVSLSKTLYPHCISRFSC